MCVESLIHTFNVGYREIIYSEQGGLRVRTGVQGNALKNRTKFTKKIFYFQVQVLWKRIINILVTFS